MPSFQYNYLSFVAMITAPYGSYPLDVRWFSTPPHFNITSEDYSIPVFTLLAR